VSDVVVVCPQERDLRALESAGLRRRYRVHLVGEDPDRSERFDPHALLEECARVPADGVIGTKDRSALLAALVAARRGLPGPSPEAVLSCQVKLIAREKERIAVPEATPRFARVAPGADTPFGPPFFVKPVVGRLSHEARRIDHESELSFLRSSSQGYAEGYSALAALAGFDPQLTRGFLAEELLEGLEVTYEGYVWQGAVTTIGVTDSVKYEGTGSFERFEYPSRLPASRQEELARIAGRVMPVLGFDGGLFNIEFFVPDREPAKIIEVNGRIASQFAPLVAAVHGRSTYDVLFELACGRDPGWRPGAPHGTAVSYCLRAFGDSLVRAVPEPQEGLEVLVEPGRRLSEQGVNDVASYRLAIFTEWGETRQAAVERARERARSLRFVLES
jgi:hypothetical protein